MDGQTVEDFRLVFLSIELFISKCVASAILPGLIAERFCSGARDCQHERITRLCVFGVKLLFSFSKWSQHARIWCHGRRFTSNTRMDSSIFTKFELDWSGNVGQVNVRLWAPRWRLLYATSPVDVIEGSGKRRLRRWLQPFVESRHCDRHSFWERRDIPKVLKSAQKTDSLFHAYLRR